MTDGILGNSVGAFGFPKTFILTDENGTELTGVVVGQETIFTATDNDVREGYVYAGDDGVSTGSKFIPPYNTIQGVRLIPIGSECKIYITDEKLLNLYDYTAFQCIVCAWNTNIADSVLADKIVVENMIYPIQSTVAESSITKNTESKTIEFGITNNTENMYVLRYFMYKEIE